MLIVDKLKGNLYTRIKKHMTKKMYHRSGWMSTTSAMSCGTSRRRTPAMRSWLRGISAAGCR